ncbi:hypothetical protein MOV61_23290 [Neorhizobium sp. BETTINA12A]|uniref:hypothetical protein n=1 Tax=Neorhizobium sp. BETTINA12A TaxID=2908924 RepID=UPI001FF6433F|nr:hypothetical protein [Neorhizobium sp. BETTINA12A]MCJ9753649.1 hypothetical protein [Neorhizobium sp. BETTINA12A]
MLRSVDRRWLTLFFLVSTLLCLAGLNAAISGMSIDISPLAVGQPGKAPVAAPGDKSRPATLTDLNLPDTLARPVFSPTRRDFVPPPTPPKPLAPVVAEAPPVAPPPPSIRLKGTRTVSGKFSALIVTDEKTVDWFGEGEMVLGWTIVSIEADRMSLTAGTSSALFSLYDSGTKGADGAN